MPNASKCFIRLLAPVAITGLILSLVSLCAVRPAVAGPSTVRLHGYIPSAASTSYRTGDVPTSQQIQLSFVLPLRNQSELTSLLHSLYDPSDPLYGHYLTPQQFAKEFGPTDASVQKVKDFAASSGLSVTSVTPNNTIIHAVGSASSVEKAFSVHLWTYSRGSARPFFAPSNEPSLPASVASMVIGVLGLDNARTYHPMLQRRSPFLAAGAPQEIGNGPQGSGLTPTNIKAAYNLSNITVNNAGVTPLDGTGQTLAVLELDGFTNTDITTYETQYGLPNVPLQIIPVDGGVTTPGNDADEVTLDIELQMALAPKVNKIQVYEAPNQGTALVDILTRMATDDTANSISASWGNGEDLIPTSVFDSETQALQQMQAQGQSMFFSSADSGAFTDPNEPTTPVVDDPANNQFGTGVGGTTLFTNSDGSYSSETTWNELGSGLQGLVGASGGGVSAIVSIPAYQVPIVAASSDSELSSTHRNVPDVSLDADPDVSGYSIFFGGQWLPFGGTSCAAPLWAAFTALVNQQRLANGGSNVGFVNPILYQIAALPANYAADFHDIADNSNNGFFHAETGYDDTTGLGSFNGANLLFDPNMSLALTSTITGTVTTGNPATPVPNAIIVETLASTGQIVKTTTTANDGTYTIAAPSNSTVKLDARSEGLFEQSSITAQLGQAQTLTNQNFFMLVSPHTFVNDGTPLGIQMVSSPFIYQPGLSLATILGATNLKAAVWDPTLVSYVVAPIAPADTFHLGQGYWISVPESPNFLSVSEPGTLSNASSFTISLSKGWNMIGDPFDAAVENSGITAAVNGAAAISYATAVSNGSLTDFFTWQPGDTQYEELSTSGSLQPWEGYWIFAQKPTTITIPAPI